MPHIFSVTEISRAVKDVVEAEFPFVWVRGQVSNLARPGSGHIYFSLKDEGAVLPVVWFKRNQWLGGKGSVNPLTGEVAEEEPVELDDNMEVLCAGRLTAYAPRGSYQLVAELVQEQGLGRLHLEFEALKNELAGLGYFDEDRKMALPRSPGRVALITSLAGAAIRDFLRVADRRGFGASIRVHPVRVQGAGAAGEIAAALDEVNHQDWAEVAVVTRGGGSLEDLWAFNERAVADALFRSRIPVVSGVGHEIDVTIADLTADVRAATPSHAAQILWPSAEELAQRVDEAAMRLADAFSDLIDDKSLALETLFKGLKWLSPELRLRRLERALGEEAERLGRTAGNFLRSRRERLEDISHRLARSAAPAAWEAREERLCRLGERLASAGREFLGARERPLEAAEARITALDPMGPLSRGFALVHSRATGQLVRDPGEVALGEELALTLEKGRLAALAKGKLENETDNG